MNTIRPGGEALKPMIEHELREAIAAEAARLLLRQRETQYERARRAAARSLSKRKVARENLPSDDEIQKKLYSLAGLFRQEQQRTGLAEMRVAALELMEVLEEFAPRLFGCAVEGPVIRGANITLRVVSDSLDDVADALENAGFPAHKRPAEAAGSPVANEKGETGRLHLHLRYPCEITVLSEEFGSGLVPESTDSVSLSESLDIEDLRLLLQEMHEDRERALEEQTQAAPAEHEYHPDAFPVMRMLLSRLDTIRLDLHEHPEGDALYHSLQVYELGLDERPYDEEFLLACLLHDVGLAVDRRHPVQAALDELGNLITERTQFLIRHRAEAADYLKTGRIARSLRRSEHFEELVLLARCDRDGRVPGADVSSLDEALEYIAGLETAWDDV